MDQQEKFSSPNNELVQKQADEIIEIFKNIRKTIRNKYEQIVKKYGFTEQQLSAIFFLYKTPFSTLNKLSDYMGLSKSTVSGIVDRLAKQGVVTREIPEDNRRIVKLSIAKEFKKNNDICSMKKKFMNDLLSDSLKKANQEEVEKIIYGLRQFSILLDDNE